MEGPGQSRERRVGDAFDAREPRLLRRQPVEAVVPERTRRTLRLVAQPIVMKRDVGEVATDGPEGMHVRMPLLVPVDELDAELERALRLPQEIVFVDLHQLVELLDRRDRRLADTDDADLGGLDQRDRQSRAEHARQRGRRHPAGGSASGDDD